MKTIGNMIDELEDEMAMRKAVDIKIGIWEKLFEIASKCEKKKMLMLALKELAGFSKEEIEEMFLEDKAAEEQK